MDIDKLDSRILAVLNEDARLPEAAIGKKVGTSKQVVRYRLNRFKERKIIDNYYYTMLDVGKLGFDSYYVFVQLTGLNSEEENKIYQKILKLPQIAWLVTGVGRWDAVLLFCAKTIVDFNEQLENLKMLLGSHLHEYTFTTLIQAEHIGYKFLRPSPIESLKTIPKGKIYSLDKTDKKILQIINQNARMAITEISEQTKLPLHTVHNRIKKLKKEKIIQGFRPKVNIHKLGMQWHLLLIKFNSVSKEKIKSFIEYCKKHERVYYATNTVGIYDLMLDVHVEDTEKFRKFLFDIKNSYGDVILLYESILIFEELALTYVPLVILND